MQIQFKRKAKLKQNLEIDYHVSRSQSNEPMYDHETKLQKKCDVQVDEHWTQILKMVNELDRQHAKKIIRQQLINKL